MADSPYREFVSPFDYKYQDCTVYKGVMYQCNNRNGTGGRWIEHDWDIFISSELTEIVSEISAELSATIVAMNSEITKLKRENVDLHRLFGLLLEELFERKNGVKIKNKELLEQLNYISHGN